MTTFRLVLVSLVALMAFGASAAFAQYPNPNGNVTGTPSNPNPGTGTTVQLTITATTASGAVDANAACTSAIASQPGTGASVAPASFTTGSDGRAVLTVQSGSASGQLKINVVCGSRAAGVVLAVGAPPTAPNTGTAGQESQSERGWLFIAIPLLAVVAALGVLGLRKTATRDQR